MAHCSRKVADENALSGPSIDLKKTKKNQGDSIEADGGRVGDDSGSRAMMKEAKTTYQGEYGRTEIQKQKKR